MNQLLTKYFKKKFKQKFHKPLLYDIANIFEKHGEGLYVVNIKASKDKLMSWLIGLFSGGFAHTFVVIYSRAIFKRYVWFNTGQIEILKSKIDQYYLNPPKLNDIKCLVLGSADDNGINYFDYSAYQLRQCVIYKYPLDFETEQRIALWLVSRHSYSYDFTGLIFWLLYKLFKFFNFLDDLKSWFCSELVYDAYNFAGVKIAHSDNPSPKDLHKFLRGYIIHESSD